MPERTNYKRGQSFNGLEFIREASPVYFENKKRKQPYAKRRGLFKCACGKLFITRFDRVLFGDSTSCGCKRKITLSIVSKTHGLRHHRFYNKWCDIKRRCYNDGRDDYVYYGGRGIKI